MKLDWHSVPYLGCRDGNSRLIVVPTCLQYYSKVDFKKKKNWLLILVIE